MSLILALVLIAIVLCKAGGEKSKAAEFDKKKNERDKDVSILENQYVDKDFEAVLEHYIADEDNYAAVHKEVSRVFETMPHWNHLANSVFPLNISQICDRRDHRVATEEVRKNQAIALDIMLANRGKISSNAFAFGYKAYILHGTKELKEQSYEYVKTILAILRNRGACVNLFYYRYLSDDAYIWEGSLADHRHGSLGEVVMEFDDSLLSPVQIPPVE